MQLQPLRAVWFGEDEHSVGNSVAVHFMQADATIHMMGIKVLEVKKNDDNVDVIQLNKTHLKDLELFVMQRRHKALLQKEEGMRQPNRPYDFRIWAHKEVGS